MKKSVFSWIIGLAALALCACTQPAAPIIYKGSEFFGREHEGNVNTGENETFDENAPRYKRGYARPVEDAAVTSVGVADLPAPTAGGGTGVESHALSAPAVHGTGNGQTHFLNQEAPHSNASVEVKDQPIAQEQSIAAEKETPVPPHKISEQKSHSQFIWPVDGGKVISHFDGGAKENGKGNDGINIAISEGEPIFATADGTVVYAGSELAGYGNMIILKHEDGWMSAYAHARSLAVKKGSKVKQSDLIAYVGSTGGVKTPQVHFVLRKGKTPVNPEEYLPKSSG